MFAQSRVLAAPRPLRFHLPLAALTESALSSRGTPLQPRSLPPQSPVSPARSYARHRFSPARQLQNRLPVFAPHAAGPVLPRAPAAPSPWWPSRSSAAPFPVAAPQRRVAKPATTPHRSQCSPRPPMPSPPSLLSNATSRAASFFPATSATTFRAGFAFQSGMSPCFFCGRSSRFPCSDSRARATYLRVSAGSIMSSTSRRPAAT
jgi:hypothetical protein